jgi:predicted transposase/invertase (TIGR01784 family)
MPETTQLLDPKNDYVFKRLFTSAPELLVSLINAIRTDMPPITRVEILNPRIEPEELTGKFIILDILAEDAEGRLYNIEMQMRCHPAWGARGVYYLASLLSAQLKSGMDYTELRPVVGIHLLNFDYFKGADQQQQAVWCFELRDSTQPKVKIGNELQLNLIELPKADRLGLKHPTQSALSAWVALMEHWQEEDAMTEIAYPPVQQALGILKNLSADEEARRLALVRERALLNEITELNAARREGEAMGEARGEAKAMQDALGKLIASGMSEDQARKILGLN